MVVEQQPCTEGCSTGTTRSLRGRIKHEKSQTPYSLCQACSLLHLISRRRGILCVQYAMSGRSDSPTDPSVRVRDHRVALGSIRPIFLHLPYAILTYDTLLRLLHAKSGTELGYDPTRISF
eukprot:3941574-Rhodomonas_salina.3